MRKKNCNLTRMRRLADAALKNVCVGFVGVDGDEKCEVISTSKIDFIRPTLTLTNAITQNPHRWCILLAAFGIDNSGKSYFKSNEVLTSARYYHHDLTTVLIEHHKTLLDGFNKNHLIQTGWLASPSITEWDENKAAKIFDLMEPWQVNNLIKE